MVLDSPGYGSRLWYGGSFPGISLRVAGGPLALWLAGKPRKESPFVGRTPLSNVVVNVVRDLAINYQ